VGVGNRRGDDEAGIDQRPRRMQAGARRRYLTNRGRETRTVFDRQTDRLFHSQRRRRRLRQNKCRRKQEHKKDNSQRRPPDTYRNRVSGRRQERISEVMGWRDDEPGSNDEIEKVSGGRWGTKAQRKVRDGRDRWAARLDGGNDRLGSERDVDDRQYGQ